MKKAIKCKCPKCGEIGTQHLIIDLKHKREYLQIIHKGKVCSLGRARTTKEVYKEMEIWN